MKTVFLKMQYTLNFIDSRIKSFLNTLYTPKVLLNQMFLLSSREVLRFKFERSCKIYFVIN